MAFENEGVLVLSDSPRYSQTYILANSNFNSTSWPAAYVDSIANHITEILNHSTVKNPSVWLTITINDDIEQDLHFFMQESNDFEPI
jgi:hypothetical protein